MVVLRFPNRGAPNQRVGTHSPSGILYQSPLGETKVWTITPATSFNSACSQLCIVYPDPELSKRLLLLPAAYFLTGVWWLYDRTPLARVQRFPSMGTNALYIAAGMVHLCAFYPPIQIHKLATNFNHLPAYFHWWCLLFCAQLLPLQIHHILYGATILFPDHLCWCCCQY